MDNIVIVGAGGFAREVRQWICDTWDTGSEGIKGFLSNNPRDLDGFNISEGILGDPETYAIQPEDRFVLAIGEISTRKRLCESLKKRGAQFLTLVHRTAIVADSVILGEGVVVCPYALVSCNCEIGDFVMMNTYSSCGHDSRIGSHCVLSPYAVINGFVTLGEAVFMATHSTVIPRISVGSNSKISANSVAMKRVPENSLVCGVPGKMIKAY